MFNFTKKLLIASIFLSGSTVAADLQTSKLSINTTPKFVFCEKNGNPGQYNVFIIVTDSNVQDVLFYRHITTVDANMSWTKSTGAALGGNYTDYDCQTKNLNDLLADGQASY
ncbi:MAG: hypothetical protein ACI8WB_005038 [Phenylobacterium sp.]|jgi:hypothetical protein